MCKMGDADLDKIFEREPNVGEEICIAHSVVNRWCFNQLYELVKPGSRKSLTANEHNQLKRKVLHESKIRHSKEAAP